MEDKRPRIIEVLHKLVKCPVSGEKVVDIIYGTGDMSQVRKRPDKAIIWEIELAKEAVSQGMRLKECQS